MLKNIVIRMQNLGKEIFGIFLLVCGVEIIIPIAKVIMSRKLLAREVIIVLRFLTLTSPLLRERCVKYRVAQERGERPFENAGLKVLFGHDSFHAAWILVSKIEMKILDYVGKKMQGTVSRLLSKPEKIPFL